MDIQVRDWHKSKDECTHQDTNNTSNEVWTGTFNHHDPFTVEINRADHEFRVSPKDGTILLFSEWQNLDAIKQYLVSSVTEFIWTYK